ncbi:MAG: hypothetical protein ACR2QC_07840 [Gammaproteobacteria bacterium]
MRKPVDARPNFGQITGSNPRAIIQSSNQVVANITRLLRRYGRHINRNPAGQTLVLVHRNGANQASIAGTPTLVNYTTAAIDNNNSWFDLTSERFIPKVEGWYLLAAAAKFQTPGDGIVIQQRLTKNGSTVVAIADAVPGAGGVSVSCPACLVMVEFNGSTDYVEHYVLQSGGGGTLQGASESTRFMAWRLL